MTIGKENEILEFKKSTGELREAIISMSAILNKHGGGDLYFGVQNDGTPVGQMIGEQTLRDISQAISNGIEPRIYPNINAVYIDRKHCIHIEFSGNNAPYFAFGRAYLRVADEDRVMVSTELEAFYLRKSAGRDSWDSELSGKTIDNVEDDILDEYLQKAKQAGRIDFEHTDAKNTLDKLYLTNCDAINNAACAVFIGFPLLGVQMAIFATQQKLTFLDIRRGRGNIRQLIEIAVKYIVDNIRWRVVLDGSVQRKEIPEIPIDAIREAITNSYCHRDYRSTQNNEIAIFSNRIEIYNPGRFPDAHSPEDYINGNAASIKRNPNIAQLLYYSKDIESFGTGLSRIAEACAAEQVRLEFERSELGFKVIFYRPENHLNTHSDSIKYNAEKHDRTNSDRGNIGKQEMATITVSDATNDAGDVTNNTNDVPNNTSDVINDTNDVTNGINDVIKDVVSSILSENQIKILEIMLSDPKVTAKTLSESIGINTRNVQANIKSLKTMGLLNRIGPTKGGQWIVKTG